MLVCINCGEEILADFYYHIMEDDFCIECVEEMREQTPSKEHLEMQQVDDKIKERQTTLFD